MDEFVCVTLTGRAHESEAEFKTRLYAFWTHMLRNLPDDYERVYAEATEFESHGDSVTRQYMVEPAGLDALTAALAEHGIAHEAIDEDDTYSKYEAAAPDWFQLEH